MMAAKQVTKKKKTKLRERLTQHSRTSEIIANISRPVGHTESFWCLCIRACITYSTVRLANVKGGFDHCGGRWAFPQILILSAGGLAQSECKRKGRTFSFSFQQCRINCPTNDAITLIMYLKCKMQTRERQSSEQFYTGSQMTQNWPIGLLCCAAEWLVNFPPTLAIVTSISFSDTKREIATCRKYCWPLLGRHDGGQRGVNNNNSSNKQEIGTGLIRAQVIQPSWRKPK